MASNARQEAALHATHATRLTQRPPLRRAGPTHSHQSSSSQLKALCRAHPPGQSADQCWIVFKDEQVGRDFFQDRYSRGSVIFPAMALAATVAGEARKTWDSL